jgi:3-mercaptopyruvate sulfurtransferase SseA
MSDRSRRTYLDDPRTARAVGLVAFGLHLLGVEDVAVYDGSLAEWGRTDLPWGTD